MTSTVVKYNLKIDKIEISMRLGSDNFTALQIVDDTLGMLIDCGEATELRGNRYPNSSRRARLVKIFLLRERNLNLIVETGVAVDRNQQRQPYAKFIFNVQALRFNQFACNLLHQVMLELLPGGGYSELIEDGFILYVEFAADFRNVDAATLDAYCPGLDETDYLPGGGSITTINLHDQRRGRPEAFCIYDKFLSDRARHARIRRPPLTRIEARRRLNRTPAYRSLRLTELDRIPNPFASLQIFDREKIVATFTANRHRNFLAQAQSTGVQNALAGNRGGDRARRERMLENCRAEWWDPIDTWAGLPQAVQVVRDLGLY